MRSSEECQTRVYFLLGDYDLAIFSGIFATQEMANIFQCVGILMVIFANSGSSLRCSKRTCPANMKCVLGNCVRDVKCPAWQKFGQHPPSEKDCEKPRDPNSRPATGMEEWFTKEVFNDLFPKANLGWGPNSCWPYSYEAFVIASRYFPKFGTEAPKNGYSTEDNYRRDLAAFFAHAIQETGENDASIYTTLKNKDEADACFYRGGLYNWFEGGPVSAFLPKDSPGHQPKDGDKCVAAGRYCFPSKVNTCNDEKDGNYFKGCYFGRGPIQLTGNFNYRQFQEWLKGQKINVDLLKKPNLLMTKMDPPLAMMASLWFFMTPQPPKPAMHDIVLGKWKAGPADIESNYTGPAFGPTSLVVNNECGGEDPDVVGGPGESRRIKAFKWFSKYFGFKLENEALLSCKNMKVKFDQMAIPVSYQLDWATSWKNEPCNCAPATYGGPIPYFEPGHYDQSFVDQNEENRKKCVKSVYADPKSHNMDSETSACLNVNSQGL